MQGKFINLKLNKNIINKCSDRIILIFCEAYKHSHNVITILVLNFLAYL